MAFADSIAGDWKIRDNRENVTLISHATAGDTAYTLSATNGAAKRRALSFKELAASAGVYTAQDKAWLIPVANLPAGIAPKMADRVRDSAGVDWTVLSADLNTYSTWYKCITRNIVLVAGLRDSADVFRPTNTQDNSGNRVPDYGSTPVYAAVPCRLQEIEGERVEQFGKLSFLKRFKCYLGQRLVVTTEDQVRINGVTYQIKGYDNPDRIDLLMSLDLELAP